MSRASGADGPEDVDATFERIVADLKAEGLGADTDEIERDLADEDVDDTDDDDDRGADPDGSGRAGGDLREPSRRRGRPTRGADDTRAGSGWREAGTDWDETLFGEDPTDDDEHFVPPDPPPLPRPKKGAFVVLLFFVVGIVLVSAPGVIGLTSSIGLPLGLLALATGIALLLLRVRQGPPDGADPTNGAQV